MNYLELHRDEIFKKYTTEELLKDIDSYKNGGGRLNKLLSHFFKECMYKCCGKKTKISPYDALSNEDLTDKLISYVNSKPKFFTSKSEVANVESCLRNSMSWVRKVANFPCKNARDIYFRYHDINGDRLNILDTSSGFGSRMSAVMLSGHNYCGFDPNKELHLKLREMYEFFKQNNIILEEQRCGLYCSGSEIFKPELENKFDVSFTSPPYFNLEKYSDDENESTKNYDNYSLWVENFVKPTVQNTYKYLKTGGYAMINIKNISKKETCFDDFYSEFSEIGGFEFVEIFDMEITKKQYGMAHDNEKGVIENKEPIMVFKKIK